MKCSNCGKEMRKGYLFSSKDGAFSFANEVPGVFENAKNADGFVENTNRSRMLRRMQNAGDSLLKGMSWELRQIEYIFIR